jgi:hypothetical protein
MPKNKLKFSSSVNEETKNKVSSEVLEALGGRQIKFPRHISYYQDVGANQPNDTIVYFDKDPVPKEVNLSKNSRMVFSNEPQFLAHEIALSHVCDEDQEINPDIFFTSKIIFKKQFILEDLKEFKQIEKYLDENFSEQVSFSTTILTVLDELVKNSFDQIIKENVKTKVIVDIIKADGDQWGIKVKDFLGTLDHLSLQKNFSIYKEEKLKVDRNTMGAGFGLGMVMSLAHRFYVIVKKNVSTEILFIYDSRLKVKRSFQYFEI